MSQDYEKIPRSAPLALRQGALCIFWRPLSREAPRIDDGDAALEARPRLLRRRGPATLRGTRAGLSRCGPDEAGRAGEPRRVGRGGPRWAGTSDAWSRKALSIESAPNSQHPRTDLLHAMGSFDRPYY